MSSVPRVALGGETLNRKWYCDLNTGTYAAPVWTPVAGITDFKPSFAPTLQEDSDFDGAGAKSKVATAYEWGVDLNLARKVKASDSASYDDGQEAIRAAAAQIGLGNVLDIRFYEVTSGGPKAEAYRGYVVASWGEDGGSMDALDTVTLTLDGRGARTPITHPDGAQVVPTTTALSPSGGAAVGGTLVRIVGTGFMKAGVDDVVASTGVKFDTTAAASWIVESDNVIYAVAPAHAAGGISVKVTNSAGASVTMATFTYS